FDGFKLKDNFIIYQYINTAFTDAGTFIMNFYRRLTGMTDLSLAEFDRKRFFINGLHESRAKSTVHVDCRANHFPGQSFDIVSQIKHGTPYTRLPSLYSSSWLRG